MNLFLSVLLWGLFGSIVVSFVSIVVSSVSTFVCAFCNCGSVCCRDSGGRFETEVFGARFVGGCGTSCPCGPSASR